MFKKTSLLFVGLVGLTAGVGASYADLKAFDYYHREETRYFDIYSGTEKVISAQIFRSIPFTWHENPYSGCMWKDFDTDLSRISFERIKSSVFESCQYLEKDYELRFFEVKNRKMLGEITTIEGVLAAEQIKYLFSPIGSSPRSDSSAESIAGAGAAGSPRSPRHVRKSEEIAEMIAAGELKRVARAAKKAQGSPGSPKSPRDARS
jgi:hypothetical protein